MRNSEIDFLFITALAEERDAILGLFDFSQSQTDSFIYYTAELGTRNRLKLALVMLSNMGNVSSAIRTTKAIAEFNPKYVLMVGIAGGLKGKVSLGDVVVSTEIFYYELAKSQKMGLELRPQFISVDPLLQNCAENLSTNLWVNELVKIFSPNEKLPVSLPKVYFGPLACGEKVVADEGFIKKLLNFQPKLLGVEMESYGVARAAAEDLSRPRFIAIRGVSDYANGEKNDDYHNYAATAAAMFAKALISSEMLATESSKRTPFTLIRVKHISMGYLPSSVVDKAISHLAPSSQMSEFVIDHVSFFENKEASDPIGAARLQQEKIKELMLLVRDLNNIGLVYYGVVHIPMAFLFGSQFKPRAPMHFVEHNRKDEQWKYLSSEQEFPPLLINGLPVEESKSKGDVIVNVSLSYKILEEDVLHLVPSPLAIVDIAVSTPELDIVNSADQLNAYAMAFRKTLDEIHKMLPNTVTVHIFYAGPVSLAFRCGQMISPTIDPRINVYNYSNQHSPKYKWGICLSATTDSPDFFVQI